MGRDSWIDRVRSQVVGVETFVPLLDGGLRRYNSLSIIERPIPGSYLSLILALGGAKH